MALAKYLLLVFGLLVCSCDGQEARKISSRFTKVVRPTFGQIWPKPQYAFYSGQVFTLIPEAFQFNSNRPDCDILEEALNRYYDLIFNPPRRTNNPSRSHFLNSVDRDVGTLDALNVELDGRCERWPYHGMDETYKIVIGKNGQALLKGRSVWGLLRGLESFSQLVYFKSDGNFYVNASVITDFPRFPYRGLLLDTSRHFVPVKHILQNLDAMAQNKYNVFHWHIVDDDSFPYQSRKFPEITKKGSFISTTHVYSVAEISHVINYARLRGIRVVAEYDTPGHTESWGPGQPGLLTPCYANVSGKLEIVSYGPINPILNSTYNFLENLFEEIQNVFPDQYLHLGGDEVSFDCWKSNPDVTAFMKKMGFGDDYSKLESYYMGRLVKIIENIGRKYIVWQEVFDNRVSLKSDTVVHVWKADPEPMEEMKAVTKAGYQAILSSCWYLSDFKMGNDWVHFYPCEPMNFTGGQHQKRLVIGGETCLWGEYADATNMMSRLWPRALAPAERLWSSQAVNNTLAAIPRFEEQRCRMVLRGLNAEPVNGPSFCPADYLV